MEKIQQFTCTTKKGNTLQFFYNPDNNLVVVDLIHQNEQGGNEILRQTLNENKLLKHTKATALPPCGDLEAWEYQYANE